MNIKLRNLLFILLALITRTLVAQDVKDLSFEDAIDLMQSDNQSLKIADKEIEIAKSERDKLNAFWYPSLQSSGTYVHLSQKIEVRQPLSKYTDPAKAYIDKILPDNQFINGILDDIGNYVFRLPLTPTNLATINVNAEWVVFSGGKRFRATKIGRTMVELAHENRDQVDATQRTVLVEAYYGLRLAQQVVKVREESYNSLKRHYENALKLESTGMIDKAARLFAQVNMDEAKRFLEDARKDESIVQNTLQTILNVEGEGFLIQPTSPLFMNDELPPKTDFVLTMQTENYIIAGLHLQQEMSKQQTRIDQTGYMPNIAVFGTQTLWAHGLQKNLMPRTILGVGFTWNLFDGLEREKRIRQSKLTSQTLALGKEKAKDDLTILIDQFYSQMQKAQDNVKALNTSIELSEELLRIRKTAFMEGMATSTDVIDAETLLSTVKVARLAAYYEYDVALMNLLAICGVPEQFNMYNN